MLRLLVYLWAAPVTLAGLPLALVCRMSGGKLQIVGGVLEATGGALGGFLHHLNPRLSIEAMTLGHLIVARTAEGAAACRRHEHVHVRQYERWGVLFPVAYALASLVAWGRGGHPYHGNRFEVEARRHDAGIDGNPRVQ